jgi:hypothetical protein
MPDAGQGVTFLGGCMDDANIEVGKEATGAVTPIPAFAGQVPGDLRQAIGRAVNAWQLRTPSPHTRKAYEHDLNQFLAHAGIEAGAFELLPQIRPGSGDTIRNY